MRCFIAIITILVCLAGCDAPRSNTKPAVGGNRKLQITFLHQRDGESRPVVIAQGNLTVPASIDGSSEFDGTWRLESTGAANVTDPLGGGFVAPLTGNGELRGICTSEQCTVDLSPHKIDDNVELIFPPTLRGEGKWQYVTYAGVSASGVVRISDQGG